MLIGREISILSCITQWMIFIIESRNHIVESGRTHHHKKLELKRSIYILMYVPIPVPNNAQYVNIKRARSKYPCPFILL